MAKERQRQIIKTQPLGEGGNVKGQKSGSRKIETLERVSGKKKSNQETAQKEGMGGSGIRSCAVRLTSKVSLEKEKGTPPEGVLDK